MIVLLFCVSMFSPPLGLDWNKTYDFNIVPALEGYRYYLGDTSWGEVTYVGLEDLLGLEAEVQIFFYKKVASKALMILGPAGLNDLNCITKYKKMVSLISEKYGDKRYVLEEKDPSLKELVYTSACMPFLIGMRKIITIWRTKKYIIKASLLGDSDGYYIEIEYKKHNSDQNLMKARKSKILKKL